MKKVLKKIFKFLDSHRFILVFIILLLFTIMFLGLKVISFLNYDFEALQCTSKASNRYCKHKDIEIFKDPIKEKEEFFKQNKALIKRLKKDYNLPAFNFYTSYYYEIAALLNYEYTKEFKELYDFFEVYNNTYDIENFYKKNIIYFEKFYPYKVL